MKRTLLAMSALFVAATGFSQTSVLSSQAKQASLPRLNERFQGVRVSNKAPKVNHSASTGLYFTTPEGGFYEGYGLDGSGYYFSKLVVPFNTPTTFTKVGTGSWSLHGTPSSASDNYNFQAPYGEGMFYGPTLIQGTDSFCLGSNNIYTKLLDNNDSRLSDAEKTKLTEISAPLHWGVMGPDSTALLYACDDHGSFIYNGTTYTNGAAFGFLDSHYLFGSGSVEEKGKTYTSYAIEQYMGKTTAPLYVENIVTEGRTSVAAGPLTKGATLTAYVCGVTPNADDPTSFDADLDNVLDTLTATASDALDFQTADNEGKIVTYTGHLVFSKKTVDEFGTETTEPFIIPANTQFAIVVDGLDKDGVSYGIDGLRLNDDADANVQNGYISVKTSDGTHYHNAFTFSSRLAAKIALNAMYDGAKAPENPGGLFKFEDANLKYNVVRISNDGQTNLTDGATASVFDDKNANGLPGALVETVLPFFNADESVNYDIKDLPDWVSNVNVTVLDDEAKCYVLTFNAKALPEGTTKRAATVYVVSDKGAVSNPIYLLQGDASVSDGISSASIENVGNKADFRTYNLAGQQVSKAYKGVVISNGKKFIQK